MVRFDLVDEKGFTHNLTHHGTPLGPEASGGWYGESSSRSSTEIRRILTYDARIRLTAVAASGNLPAVSYTYDSEGHRTAVTQGGQTTQFALDPTGLSKVLVRTKADGSKTYYVYGHGLLYQVDEAGNTVTYHYDLRGSTVALTDSQNTVLERVEYSVYGQITRRAGTTVDTPFLYNGCFGVQTDPNSLLYMRARYYNPCLKRFVNADPSGFGGGLNWYAYADGNPVSAVDPFGLGATEVGGWSWISPSLSADTGGGTPISPGSTFSPAPPWTYNALCPPLWVGTPVGEQFARMEADAIVTAPGYAKIGSLVGQAYRAMVGAGELAAESGAANRAAFEGYKDSLRAQMSRPAASNPELNSLLDKLYRPNAQVGSGSTAAAVRQELATGQPVGGAFHSQKAQESITALQRWLNNNPTASGANRAAAENVIKDMQNALNGH